MPYVREDRRRFPHTSPQLIGTGGDLNYRITRMIIEYVQKHGLNYDTIESVRGCLDGAKSEFDRRVAFPYEDRKIRENGDVYPSDLLG